jgi:AcrR family transcriptional regulator
MCRTGGDYDCAISGNLLCFQHMTLSALHSVIERKLAVADRVAARRGRPRDAGVDERVMAVAWELLRARGYAGLNVDEVAERAAVAKTTLYRRWPTKDHLVVAAATRMVPAVPVPDTGDLRRDLTEFAVGLAARLTKYRMAGSDGVSAGLAAELVAAAARHPDLGDMLRDVDARRHTLALDRLRRASEQGALRPGVDHAIVIDQVSGPIYYRILITGATADRSYAERLVNAVLDGVLRQGSQPG